MGEGRGRRNQVEREEAGDESLYSTGLSCHKGFQIRSIAGVQWKKLAPKEFGEPLFNK
jgi:hypothetical protein